MEWGYGGGLLASDRFTKGTYLLIISRMITKRPRKALFCYESNTQKLIVKYLSNGLRHLNCSWNNFIQILFYLEFVCVAPIYLFRAGIYLAIK